MKENELKGKVAVVTGSSRGIGRGIAVGLGEKGATVYITGRSKGCLLYTSPSPRDKRQSRMPSSA